MTQKEISNFFLHACYLMSIAFGIKADVFSIASKALKNDWVGFDGWVKRPDLISGLHVTKITHQADGKVCELGNPDFVIYEIDDGRHFVVGKNLPSIKFGMVDGSNILYDPWVPQPSTKYHVTGCRIFRR